MFSNFPKIGFDHTGGIGAIITKVSLIWHGKHRTSKVA